MATLLSPVLVGRTTEDGLPTESSVVVGTVRAASTWGDSVVVPGSAVAAAPPVDRCEDAEADGLEFPAALITTMVAMAATTSTTGTRAVRTG